LIRYKLARESGRVDISQSTILAVRALLPIPWPDATARRTGDTGVWRNLQVTGDHSFVRWYRAPIYSDDDDQKDDRQQPEND
jgi:hypothetical protein